MQPAGCLSIIYKHSVDGVELKLNGGKKAKTVTEKISEIFLNYSVAAQSYLAVVVK
jgi:hypothetical protein